MKIQKFLEEHIGKKYIQYRNKWEQAGVQKIKLKYPLHLNFEITFGCNLKCDMCLHSIHSKDWNYKSVANRNIDFNKYCEIIDEGIKYGLSSIELNGINEPFLKKDIYKYVEYAKQKEILITSLHTNALLLDETISKNIIDSGLTLIIFSIDAFSKETYKKIRKNNNYKTVIENINIFLKIKKERKSIYPLTKVSFAKNKINHMELNDFLQFWKNKVDDYSVSSFCNPFIGKQKYNEIEEKYRLEDFDLTYCYEPYQRLLIRNNGDVVPCCSFFGGEMILGNIYQDSILNIWNSDKAKKNRLLINENRNSRPDACNKCRDSMKKNQK